MKLTKLGIGIITALLVINAVSLSYIVANQKAQHLPFDMSRIEYLQLKMDIQSLRYAMRFDLDLLGVFVLPGQTDADIELWVIWNDEVIIDKMENAIRDIFVRFIEDELKKMYRLGAWEANPTIRCIQKNGQDEVNRITQSVSTAESERHSTTQTPTRTRKTWNEGHTATDMTDSIYTCTELLAQWEELGGKAITILVPENAIVSGATLLSPVAGRANIYFNFPANAMSALNRMADNGFTTTSIYVRGVVTTGNHGSHVRHVNHCKLVSR